jgi:hypothetical protein
MTTATGHREHLLTMVFKAWKRDVKAMKVMMHGESDDELSTDDDEDRAMFPASDNAYLFAADLHLRKRSGLADDAKDAREKLRGQLGHLMQSGMTVPKQAVPSKKRAEE